MRLGVVRVVRVGLVSFRGVPRRVGHVVSDRVVAGRVVWGQVVSGRRRLPRVGGRVVAGRVVAGRVVAGRGLVRRGVVAGRGVVRRGVGLNLSRVAPLVPVGRVVVRGVVAGRGVVVSRLVRRVVGRPRSGLPLGDSHHLHAAETGLQELLHFAAFAKCVRDDSVLRRQHRNLPPQNCDPKLSGPCDLCMLAPLSVLQEELRDFRQ